MALLLTGIFAIHCGAAEAKTVRSAAVVSEFKRHNPCPANGLRRGKCPGHEIDHITPLCADGADHVSNLQWLSREDHRVKTRGDVRHCRALKRQQ
ncbi:HNH endonuclease signature motif containing protein [Polaromonas sp.]|uniref:HNH endonuclease signature motif containing protein n=1 Tax=Polaromonas sp. TaxID=1869339 RepID=UPI00286B20E3|nr:HNH endonuclease signature motif containing protein [Polaromonas sp.]